MTSQSKAVRPDLIGDMLAFGAQRHPTRTLFAIEGGESRSYAEVDQRASQLGRAMLGNGLRHGDRVAVWAEDSVEYLETYMAAARAGLAVVPVNNRLTPAEARFIVDDCDARCLMISDALADRAVEAFGNSDFPLIATYGQRSVLGATQFEELVHTAAPAELPELDEEDLFIIAYTSGTTGFPKGAMLTHRSVKNLARMNTVSYRLPLGSIAAYTGSMSFTATVCAFGMSHLFVGGTVNLLGKWNAQRAVDLIVRERANFVYVPSPGIEDFCEAIGRRPAALDTLTTVLHSASKVSPERLTTLADSVGPRLVEGWGMTEISGGIVTATTTRDVLGPCDAVNVFDSAGRATVDAVIEVVDENRQPLPHDGKSEGELAVRAASMMAGYWRRPEATAAVLVDGWYYSGDIGAIDPAGYIYIRERRVDMIISGGMNIYPAEIEGVIARMDGVDDVAVVAAPHERWGHTVAAVVVISPGATLTEDDVIEYSRNHLASYKKPTIVKFVPALPKTVSLKVKRQALRSELFGEG